MKKILLITIGLSMSLMAIVIRFDRNSETQIVTDSITFLQWQDNETVEKTWREAIDYCEALTLGDYTDWRLPNMNELYSLSEGSPISPVFQYTDSTFGYWSSTTAVDYKEYAWGILFGYDYDNIYRKSDNYYSVRCVRTGE